MKQAVYVYIPHPSRRVEAGAALMTDEQRAAHNKHAALLRAQDAALLDGPCLDGRVIIVPSWRYVSEAVQAWKRRGGMYHEGCQFTKSVSVCGVEYTETVSLPAWTIPASRATLQEVQALYSNFFAREIAMAKASQGQRDFGNSA